jgi:hypothetical protein
MDIKKRKINQVYFLKKFLYSDFFTKFPAIGWITIPDDSGGMISYGYLQQ